MSTAICDACFTTVTWRAGRGSSVRDVRCPHCRGSVRGPSKARGDAPGYCETCKTSRPRVIRVPIGDGKTYPFYNTVCRVCRPDLKTPEEIQEDELEAAIKDVEAALAARMGPGGPPEEKGFHPDTAPI